MCLQMCRFWIAAHLHIVAPYCHAIMHHAIIHHAIMKSCIMPSSHTRGITCISSTVAPVVGRACTDTAIGYSTSHSQSYDVLYSEKQISAQVLPP
jgi:acid phosphatase family membrane protein YuiD